MQNTAVAKFAQQIIDEAPWIGVAGLGLGSAVFTYVLEYDWDDVGHVEAFEEARTNPHYAPWVVSVAEGLTLGGFGPAGRPSMLHGLAAATEQGEATNIASVMQEAFAQFMTGIIVTELGRQDRITVDAPDT